MACKISQFMKPEWIIANLQARTKDALLAEMSGHLAQQSTGIDPQEMLQKLTEREQKASTGADQGLAIPHATLQSATKLMVALGRSTNGIDFGALDNDRSKFFFTIISPTKTIQPEDISYLQAISAICKLMRSQPLRTKLIAANNAEEIYQILIQEELNRDTKTTVSS